MGRQVHDPVSPLARHCRSGNVLASGIPHESDLAFNGGLGAGNSLGLPAGMGFMADWAGAHGSRSGQTDNGRRRGADHGGGNGDASGNGPGLLALHGMGSMADWAGVNRSDGMGMHGMGPLAWNGAGTSSGMGLGLFGLTSTDTGFGWLGGTGSPLGGTDSDSHRGSGTRRGAQGSLKDGSGDNRGGNRGRGVGSRGAGQASPALGNGGGHETAGDATPRDR